MRKENGDKTETQIVDVQDDSFLHWIYCEYVVTYVTWMNLNHKLQNQKETEPRGYIWFLFIYI